MAEYHVPVLLNEILELLQVKRGDKYIDCTLGGGGHTKALLGKGAVVLGIDQDTEAIENAQENFKFQILNLCVRRNSAPAHNFKLSLRKANFAHLKEIAKEAGFEKVWGILLDLGVSSHQLDTDYRGFSFNKEAVLDMRMDPATQKVTAADLVNAGSEKELANLFWKFGQERDSRRIAKAIVVARPVYTTNQLANIILSVSHKGKFDRTHPATRVFQALRMAVNDELANLEAVLPQTVELLEAGGRLAVISFHSLEDRIVKEFIRNHPDLLIGITDKPVEASEEEVRKNPRARSGKLRVARRLQPV